MRIYFKILSKNYYLEDSKILKPSRNISIEVATVCFFAEFLSNKKTAFVKTKNDALVCTKQFYFFILFLAKVHKFLFQADTTA